MKKLLSVFLIMICIAIQTGCSNNGTTITNDVDTIDTVKLTDREKMFLSVGNEAYFAFDFSVSEKYKWVEVWVDRYEFGKKVSDNGKLSIGISESMEGIILAKLTELEDSKNNWMISIKNGGSVVTSKFNQEYKDANLNKFAKTWQAISSKNNIENQKEITLASACFKDMNRGTAVSSLTDEFYRNPEENIEEIENYSLVYLLKAKFYENDPN